MPHESERPAAIWMDRLSDRIGAFVPGCSELKPRHPIKVSVVLGLLIFIGRWLEAGMLCVRGLAAFSVLTAGSVFGLLVVLPMVVWLRQPWWRVGVSVMAGMVLIILSQDLLQLFDLESFRQSIVLFFVIGLIMNLFILGLAQSRKRILTSLMYGGLFAGLAFFQVAVLIPWGIYGYNYHLAPSEKWCPLIAAQSGASMILFGGWAWPLGMALWDTTSRPKFEPVDSTP